MYGFQAKKVKNISPATLQDFIFSRFDLIDAFPDQLNVLCNKCYRSYVYELVILKYLFLIYPVENIIT